MAWLNRWTATDVEAKEVMRKALAVVMLFGLALAEGARAQAVPLGSMAPAPHLLTPSGDSYMFLSELYHEGEDHPQDRRSAVALCFIGQDSAACAEVLQRFVAVAGKVQGHESLKRQVRFYVVGTDSLGRSDSLTGFLARNRMGPPVLAFLDPHRKACQAFGADTLPRTFVISKRGILVADIEGGGSDYAKALAKGVVKAVKDSGVAQKPARVRSVAAGSARESAADPIDPDQPMRW